MSNIFQLFVYKVKDAEKALSTRQEAIAAWGESAGYIRWTPLRRSENPDGDGIVFADLVEWESPEACETGNKMFGEDARIAPFRDQITEPVTGGTFLAG